MNYRSVSQLAEDIRNWLDVLPDNFDAIAGIPRSGLLAANLLALQRNLPLSTVDEILNGNLIRGGQRCISRQRDSFLEKPKHILVIDDSLLTGSQIRATKQTIQAAESHHTFSYGVVYLEPGAESEVDHFAQILPSPRVFEWNVMHHGILPNCCVDIDGVLCRDPRREENDDGPRYINFIRNASPKVIPSRRIGWLVTSRLEKYRSLTEQWLNRYNIQYDRLVMMDFPDRQTRLAYGSCSAHKAQAFKDSDARLFIESSPRQAAEIARLSGKHVLCTADMQMYTPATAKVFCRKTSKAASLLVTDPIEFMCKLTRALNTAKSLP